MLDFDIEVLDDGVTAMLDGAIARLGPEERRKFFSVVRAKMLRSIALNFQREGRPEKWAPLTPAAIASRRHKRKVHKILTDTGNLRRSITPQINADATELKIGTNLEYARMHQEGDKAKNRPPRKFVLFQQADIAWIMKQAKRFIGK